MKINRALGLIIFLITIQLIMPNVFRAFNNAVISTFSAIDIASQTAGAQIQEIR